jgi:hypothetical protein
MWEPRRLTALRAFTACHSDSFTFYTFISVYVSEARTHVPPFLYAILAIPTAVESTPAHIRVQWISEQLENASKSS